jgi:DNA-binding transcriptional regulator YhcF (GntR family)
MLLFTIRRKEVAVEAPAEEEAEETTETCTSSEVTYVEIEKLQELGINAGDINKLKSGVSCLENAFYT